MPIVAIVSIFNGGIEIDTDRLQTMVVENLSAEEQQKLQFVEDTMYAIEDEMKAAGFTGKVKEAQVLYVLALSDYAGQSDFVSKLVGCFAEDQTDEQLIAAVNSAFGTQLTAEDFGKVMGNIRATAIDISDFTDPATKNNLDIVKWAIHAQENGWGYVYGTYGSVLDEALLTSKIAQYPDEVGGYENFIRQNWLGGRTADCVGLIKGYGWYNTETAQIEIGANGMPDIGADNVAVIDLRNPTQSDGNNLLHLVNKYMDAYKENPNDIALKARAEKYAKIIAKTLIYGDGDASAYGQNAFFYDAAEGLMTSVILLIAEFAEPKERHIVSVFKLIQELMAPSSVKGKNHFQLLLDRLPPDHKARWFAGAALSAGDQAMASVMSTALSRLNSFLDTEMEQVLCFDTAVDAERFCQEKSAIFVVMPEENPNAYFMISLLIQQLYREILSVADENGGKLPNRVMFYCDEFGTMPPIQSAEMMYSASRSRRLSIVSIIQSYQQLEKNYGREGAAIIQDNCQITIAGGFAPTSETADIVSKTLGSRTVLTGSVSRSKNDPSQSLQMTERPLMSADELKNMKKGSFIVMKTGTHPFVSPLKLFFKWGISFSDTPYTVAEHGARKVCYVSRAKIIQAITSQFPQAKNPQPKTEPNNGGPDMTERQPKVPATVRTG